MKSNLQIQKLLLPLIAITFTLFSCKESVTTVPNNEVKVEEKAGTWKTIVIPSSTTIAVSAPINSDSELDEIVNLQKTSTLQTDANISYWNNGAVVRWNEFARELVIKNKILPPVASRLYALMSIAQFDALVTTWNAKNKYNRQNPSVRDSRVRSLIHDNFSSQSYPSEHSTVAAASMAILIYIFPSDSISILAKFKEHTESRMYAGINSRSDIEAGKNIGISVANSVIDLSNTDGSNSVWTGTIPTGLGMWTTAAGKTPVLPLWGKVKTWFVDVQAMRPLPPPAFNSPEFQAQVAEVRSISDTRTAEQLAIATKWADGAGTFTPPGHWNQIASDYIRTNSLNEVRSARVMAYMNMAIMDAGICCWDAKYTYWLLRPSQADPKITTPIGLPNFPSFTSGHSSFSGAASQVLSYFFPSDSGLFKSLAQEASISRVYGGIHYRMDCDKGIVSGNNIGNLAIAKAKLDGAN